MSVSRKYFGTDGIRGRANVFPMTGDMAMRVAMATAVAFRRQNNGNGQNRVVIGKDTRLSGYLFEPAMAAGFVAMGMEVVMVGPVPTPAVAMLTRSLRADVGVMLSASHNPYQDNGIKLFGADGYKLPDPLESTIESLIDTAFLDELAAPPDIGRASRLNDAPGRYIEFLKGGLPRGLSFQGMRIVLDCANGAAYKIAPQLLWELEAEVIPIGVSPNGQNINDGCGATATESLEKAVVQHRADLGIALDGDADRVILVDEKGRRIDGDQIIALLAQDHLEKERLAGNCVVATVMSNLGLERFLGSRGVEFLRTPVGDRYVVEEMRSRGAILGGEQSGHIILSEYGTTGDGLMAALQVLSILRASGKPASELCRVFEPLPQLLRNVRYETVSPLERPDFQEAIAVAEKTFAGRGRVLVRLSGTEPLVRIMIEGENAEEIHETADRLEAILKS